ncbi:DUF4079 domain-containing protein [Cyanobium sp. FGCU-6]|jgi:hypothetical protein|nr:DUF4079 domain-containing protein [Cyanobium sp. FGCU6]
MTTVDWLWVLHPALAVVLVYPLIGMTIRLGVQTRSRRVDKAKLPASTGRDHADLGSWLAAAVVGIVLVALTVVIATKAAPGSFEGGPTRALTLLLVVMGTVVSLVALWRVRARAYRLCFALLTWIGVLGLGAQPEVYRVSDNPLSTEFWTSHYWAGVAVVGLMLFSLGARPEILREPRLRRLHVSASVLAAVLFTLQGITGSRDLLTIPLSWQKTFLGACNWSEMRCPPPPRAPALPGSP